MSSYTNPFYGLMDLLLVSCGDVFMSILYAPIYRVYQYIYDNFDDDDVHESKYLDSRIRIRRVVDWYSGTSDIYSRRIKLIEIFNYHNVDRSNDARRL